MHIAHSCLLPSTTLLCRFSHSFGRSVLTVVSAVAVDFLAIGAVIATVGWVLSNKLLRRQNQHSHAVEQSVEWCAAAADDTAFLLVLLVLPAVVTPQSCCRYPSEAGDARAL